jgi:hypothetical protein
MMTMNAKLRLAPIALFLLAPLTYPIGAVAQTQDSGVDSYIESVRADLHADKVAIITKAMNFNDKDSAAFWPIYKKYSYDLSKLDDQRIQLIKEYAQEFNTLTDAQAKDMADRTFKYQSARVDLRKKYFKEFSKVLPTVTVVKFYQLENRLDLLVNLQLASDLPPLLARADAAK